MSRINDIIEKHPMSVLITTCITVIIITTGIVGWFWEQSSSLKKLEFKNEITQVKNSLSSQIFDLQRRLLLIERRVSGKNLYIDVAKIPISSASLPTLNKTHSSFNSGKYYVAPPTFQNWESNTASHLDLIEMIYGKDHASTIINSLELKNSDFIGVLSRKKGTLWKGNKSVEVQLPSNNMISQILENNRLEMTPFLFAMHVDSSFVNEIARTIGSELIETEQDLRELEEATKNLSELLIESETTNNENDGNQAAINREVESTNMITIFDTLSDISRDDLSGFMLTDTLLSHLQFSVLTGGTMKVVSTEKKANVLYLRIHTVFPSAHYDANGMPHDVVLDEEIFFIGTNNGGVLVRTGIPSINFQTEAYVWTQGWLTTLRVPFD